jgi:dTDP-4-amino-4,6-dideoxygalactose transaminase
VPTAIYYKTPLHHMPAFSAFAPADGLPHAERATSRVLSLPMHPYLSDEQAEFVCDVLEAALDERAS